MHTHEQRSDRDHEASSALLKNLGVDQEVGSLVLSEGLAAMRDKLPRFLADVLHEVKTKVFPEGTEASPAHIGLLIVASCRAMAEAIKEGEMIAAMMIAADKARVDN